MTYISSTSVNITIANNNDLGTLHFDLRTLGKAVATDFEVVRPGSGCGLFNVGVVCFI